MKLKYTLYVPVIGTRVVCFCYNADAHILVFDFYTPFEKERAYCFAPGWLVGWSVSHSGHQMLSAQYLLTPFAWELLNLVQWETPREYR